MTPIAPRPALPTAAQARPAPRSTPSSIQVEFVELAVLGADPAHRAGHRAHHHGFGLDHVAAEAHAPEHRAGSDAGRGEQAIAPDHVHDLVALARVLDAHLEGALAAL